MAFVASELSFNPQSLCCWWALGEEATLGLSACGGAACVRPPPGTAVATPPAPALCTGEMPGLVEVRAGRDGALRLCCAAVSELVISVLNSTGNYKLKAGF